MTDAEAHATIRGRHKNELAVILGNGLSRQRFNVSAAREEGCVIFGCNAVLRDLSGLIDYVVAVDHKWRIPWDEVGDQTPRQYFYHEPHLEPAMLAVGETPKLSFRIFQGLPRKGMLSGMFCLMLATIMEFDQVCLVGFDADWSNVYRGTEHYKGAMVSGKDAQHKRIPELMTRLLVENPDLTQPDIIQFPPWSLCPPCRRVKLPEEWDASAL